MKDTIRTYNPTVKFSKFTFNIKIYEEFEGFLSKLVWRKTLFSHHLRQYKLYYTTKLIFRIIMLNLSLQNMILCQPISLQELCYSGDLRQPIKTNILQA